MKKSYFVALLFAGFSAVETASALSLEEFLTKVGVQNSSVKAESLNQEASDLRANEGYLLTSPKLFLAGNYSADKKESSNPSFEGRQRNSTQYQLGIEQQSSLGVNHRLYYGLDNSEIVGADPTFIQDATVWRSSLTYEFSLPVWRNAFGRSTRDQVEVIVKQNSAESYTAKFAQKQLKANAVAVYWKMKSAQEIHSLTKELLESNLKFLNWTKNRVKDRLAEDIDLKQAEAALALKEYQMEQAQSDLFEAQQAFNEMLELPTETQVPDLDSLPSIETYNSEMKTVDPLQREDVLSLQMQLEAQNSQSKMASEETKPQLDITGTLSSNGMDPKGNEAVSKSFRSDHPAYGIGLKLSVPLDFSSVNAVQKSAKLRASSLESQMQRKQFEVKAEFEKLQRNLSQAIRLFERSQSVEKAQLSKYNLEGSRRRTGRSTTFQLLSFQQEYQESKQALIRAQTAILQLNAQYILFQSSK